MALARARQAARRVKDRWKAKQWYKITAPVMFNQHIIGESLADEADKMLGRTVEVTMNEFTGDMKQMHIKLYFQVSDIQDLNARTAYVGHTMTSDYVRRLTRRGHTKIPLVFDVKTKDGSRVRVKPFAISDRRCQTTQAQAIRGVMQRMIEESAARNTLGGFLKDILVDDLTGRIYKEARKIHPVRRIEIAKAEIVKSPAVEVDETPVFVLESPAAPAAPEGEAEAAMDAGEEPEGPVTAGAGEEE